MSLYRDLLVALKRIGGQVKEMNCDAETGRDFTIEMSRLEKMVRDWLWQAAEKAYSIWEVI